MRLTTPNIGVDLGGLDFYLGIPMNTAVLCGVLNMMIS
jgi:hypothetical protein